MMEILTALFFLAVLVWLAYTIVIAPVVYILSPTVEREAVVLGKSDEINVRSGLNAGSVYSTTSYMVTLKFQDGTARDYRCSRSVFGQAYRGDEVAARTKGRKLLALR